MKKIAALMIFAAVLALGLSSCTTHENCAAYNKVELPAEAPAK